MTVAIVTDSSAYLPSDLAGKHRIFVVPLHVAINGVSYDEGVDVQAADVATALRDYQPVTTSRPSPGAFLQVYDDLIARGVTEIVSVHMSGQMSATISSAEVAAAEADAEVRVVDSQTMGMAMGFAVIAAVEAAEAGASLDEVAEAARREAAASRTFFYVDTLEFLRRGGRVGKASALFGSALSIKPLLTLQDGHIEPLERVRTSSKALARLEKLAIAAAAEAQDADGVDIAVQQLDALERAESLVERLAENIPNARRVMLVELGAAVGAHVGPGTLGVAIAPRSAGRQRLLGASD